MFTHRVSGEGEKDKDEEDSPGQFNAGPPLAFFSVAKRESAAQLCDPLPLEKRRRGRQSCRRRERWQISLAFAKTCSMWTQNTRQGSHYNNRGRPLLYRIGSGDAKMKSEWGVNINGSI